MRGRQKLGLVVSQVEQADLLEKVGVEEMLYKKGMVNIKFTCGLLIEGLQQDAPPSVARLYMNGVIRVDDLLVCTAVSVRFSAQTASVVPSQSHLTARRIPPRMRITVLGVAGRRRP